MVSLFVLCKHKRQVSFKQLVFIYYGGLIRGAISFGLVLTIENNENVPNRDVIITTTLALVVITTVVFGSFTGMVQTWLVPPDSEEKHEYDELEIVDEIDVESSDDEVQSFRAHTAHFSDEVKRKSESDRKRNSKKAKKLIQSNEKKKKAMSLSMSIHEAHMHPNEE
jgi:NhaP-type Na+/H+ or K+/H+ antiporter